MTNPLPQLVLGLALPDEPLRTWPEVVFEVDDSRPPWDLDAELVKLQRRDPKRSADEISADPRHPIHHIPGKSSEESLQL
jgi:hypothetical protein